MSMLFTLSSGIFFPLHIKHISNDMTHTYHYTTVPLVYSYYIIHGPSVWPFVVHKRGEDGNSILSCVCSDSVHKRCTSVMGNLNNVFCWLCIVVIKQWKQKWKASILEISPSSVLINYVTFGIWLEQRGLSKKLWLDGWKIVSWLQNNVLYASCIRNVTGVSCQWNLGY